MYTAELCFACVGLTIDPHYHTITLTTVSLLRSTINRSSLGASDPRTPPNSAALLSPTGVSVNSEHGGGGCPVMFGELHSPAGGDDIISHYTAWYNTMHSRIRTCTMKSIFETLGCF